MTAPWALSLVGQAALILARHRAGQGGDVSSLLGLTRALLALRRQWPVLRNGDLVNLSAKGDLLVFDRVEGGQRIACRFNLGPDAQALPEPLPVST